MNGANVFALRTVAMIAVIFVAILCLLRSMENNPQYNTGTSTTIESNTNDSTKRTLSDLKEKFYKMTDSEMVSIS